MKTRSRSCCQKRITLVLKLAEKISHPLFSVHHIILVGSFFFGDFPSLVEMATFEGSRFIHSVGRGDVSDVIAEFQENQLYYFPLTCHSGQYKNYCHERYLTIATGRGHVDVAELLLCIGAQPDLSLGKSSQSNLSVAAQSGSLDLCLLHIRALGDLFQMAIASANGTASERGQAEETRLSDAMSVDFASYASTALWVASKRGCEKVISLLLRPQAFG